MQLSKSLLAVLTAYATATGSAQQPLAIDLVSGYFPDTFNNLRLTTLSGDASPWVQMGLSSMEPLLRVTTAGNAQSTTQSPLDPVGPYFFADTQSIETPGGALVALPRPNFLSTQGALYFYPADGSAPSPIGDLTSPIFSLRPQLARVGAEVWALAQDSGSRLEVWRIGSNGQLIGSVPISILSQSEALANASIHSFGNRALLFTSLPGTSTLWSIDTLLGATQLTQFQLPAGSGFPSLEDADYGNSKLLGLSGAGTDSGIWFVDQDLGVAPVGARTPPNQLHHFAVEGQLAYAVSSAFTFSNPETRILKFNPTGTLTSLSLPVGTAAASGAYAIVNGKVVFPKLSSDFTLQPWASDGSLAGTAELASVSMLFSAGFGKSDSILRAGSAVYFAGRNASGNLGSTGPTARPRAPLR